MQLKAKDIKKDGISDRDSKKRASKDLLLRQSSLIPKNTRLISELSIATASTLAKLLIQNPTL